MTILLDGTNGVTTAGITLGSTAIASTGDEINILDGVTSTAAELNLLDGVTSTTAELNILDGVTSTAAELNILDGVTSTAAELNIMDGVTATAAEINLIDGGTARGTTALADGDGILINDAGTMRMSTVQTVKTYMTDGVGTSTAFGAIGTYCICHNTALPAAKMYHPNRTTAGSNLQMRIIDSVAGINTDNAADFSAGSNTTSSAHSNGDLPSGFINTGALSGTWRQMSPDAYPETNKRTGAALYVRIS